MSTDKAPRRRILKAITCPGARACIDAVADGRSPRVRYKVAYRILGLRRPRGRNKGRLIKNRSPEHRKQRNRRRSLNREAKIRGAGGRVYARDIRFLWHWQAGRCFWCDVEVSPHPGGAHFDHVMPLAGGGRHEGDNLVISCPPCNLAKSALMPWEWRPDLFSEVPAEKLSAFQTNP